MSRQQAKLVLNFATGDASLLSLGTNPSTIVRAGHGVEDVLCERAAVYDLAAGDTVCLWRTECRYRLLIEPASAAIEPASAAAANATDTAISAAAGDASETTDASASDARKAAVAAPGSPASAAKPPPPSSAPPSKAVLSPARRLASGGVKSASSPALERSASAGVGDPYGGNTRPSTPLGSRRPSMLGLSSAEASAADDAPLQGEQSKLYFAWCRRLKETGLSSERRQALGRLLAQNEVPEEVLSDVSGPGHMLLDHDALKSMGVALAADRMHVLSCLESRRRRRVRDSGSGSGSSSLRKSSLTARDVEALDADPDEWTASGAHGALLRRLEQQAHEIGVLAAKLDAAHAELDSLRGGGGGGGATPKTPTRSASSSTKRRTLGREKKDDGGAAAAASPSADKKLNKSGSTSNAGAGGKWQAADKQRAKERPTKARPGAAVAAPAPAPQSDAAGAPAGHGAAPHGGACVHGRDGNAHRPEHGPEGRYPTGAAGDESA